MYARAFLYLLITLQIHKIAREPDFRYYALGMV